ncbi:MAG: sulfotransferase domain-containing protein [Ilumatobacteraceae bacterium]
MNVAAARGNDAMPRRIDAAIVGVQKCGTTSLAAMLAEHPQVCLAAGKEAHLFDDPEVQRSGVATARFDGLFAHRRPGQLLLDATPSYLYLPGCLEALLVHNPDVKVIVVLRPAGERAVSHHDHERRRGVERRSLPVALLVERWRLRRDREPLSPSSAHRVAAYLDRGRYAAQLHRLLGLTARVHVLTLADLVAEPDRVFAEVQRFLGVEVVPAGVVPQLNVGSAAPGSLIRWWLDVVTRREMARTADVLGEPEASLRPTPRGRR